MPRKDQGWVTFQTSEEERQILEEICQLSQRSKTEVLRELVRGLRQAGSIEAASMPQAGGAAVESAPSSRSSAPPPAEPGHVPKRSLKVSSRNILKGRVKQVVTGSVNSEVVLEVLAPIELTAVITTASAEELGLTQGAEAYAVIKSSDVVIAME